MKKKLLGILLALALVVGMSTPSLAATTADITLNAIPAYVSISSDQSVYDFGVVVASATPSTTTSWATIDNTSTIQTDHTISVTTATWSGGVTWTHSDTATIGTDTAGLKANKGGTWGVGDIIVKNASPNYIAENQAATTDYSFGLKLLAPDVFSDGIEKEIVVRVSAASG
jgi:hypothetical protein